MRMEIPSKDNDLLHYHTLFISKTPFVWLVWRSKFGNWKFRGGFRRSFPVAISVRRKRDD